MCLLLTQLSQLQHYYCTNKLASASTTRTATTMALAKIAPRISRKKMNKNTSPETNNFRYKWGIKQKLFRIKKTLVSNKISYKNIFQMWVGYTFFDPKYFFDQATGGSKCSSSPLEGIKKKIFQTEIDFAVGSRLPPGAAIQNMNPFWVGLRFIDGCFRVYFGVGLRFFWGIGIRSV